MNFEKLIIESICYIFIKTKNEGKNSHFITEQNKIYKLN